MKVYRLSPFRLWCMVVGMFGCMGMAGELVNPDRVPFWLVLLVYSTPLAIVIFFEAGHRAPPWLQRLHLIAGVWYILAAVASELVVFSLGAPDGILFFRVLAHFGWLQFWPLVASHLRQRSGRDPESDTGP